MKTKIDSWEKISIFFFVQKQPSIGVLTKRCSENMQQVYRRTPMLKCYFNNVAKQLYWNPTLAWVFPVNLLNNFGIPFSKPLMEDCFSSLYAHTQPTKVESGQPYGTKPKVFLPSLILTHERDQIINKVSIIKTLHTTRKVGTNANIVPGHLRDLAPYVKHSFLANFLSFWAYRLTPKNANNYS